MSAWSENVALFFFIILSETINILRKLHKLKLTFSGCPRKSYHKTSYVHSSL